MVLLFCNVNRSRSLYTEQQEMPSNSHVPQSCMSARQGAEHSAIWDLGCRFEMSIMIIIINSGSIINIRERKMVYYGHILPKGWGYFIKASSKVQRQYDRTQLGRTIVRKGWQIGGILVTRLVEDRAQWRKIVLDASNPSFEEEWRQEKQAYYYYCHHHPVVTPLHRQRGHSFDDWSISRRSNNLIMTFKRLRLATYSYMSISSSQHLTYL